MSIILGCIADDLTGATDLAMILVREGMKTVQIVGVPDENTPLPSAEAVVVALKSRTIPAAKAIEMSVKTCAWLRAAGAGQIFFKYCSTFDSTSEGNIGPVTDALMEKLSCNSTIACPAFPENGRSVYKGYLFVNEGLLSESSLRNHPLTPMTDPNLNRVLSSQSTSYINNITFEDVSRGPGAIVDALTQNQGTGRTIAIIDALDDHHLRSIGQACKDMILVTGGSALAQGLPDNYRAAGLMPHQQRAPRFVFPAGTEAILSGSCSEATLAQIEFAKAHLPHFQLDPRAILDGAPVVEQALHWAQAVIEPGTPVMIYSSAPAAQVAETQHTHGRMESGDMIEQTLGQIAKCLRNSGVKRFVVAGGETSGAVINALGISSMEIGPEIDPGVPWTRSTGPDPLALALKSGNFGGENFFLKAFAIANSVK
ncbi:four-carbon acid sugar kinase family protein [Kiloniella laminariae]|uniref:3-oxo-tetronate kinase n=1 Tax=Kiloniella laminariae TaxID=454162 RepID=A0ABT4LK74_9PROT|nr:3-oxo-tetronate kinase [Kiloniella laminariae]MCZ4281477.1 four-carbon acid sugar kinase family protein [Kiloniella laminariae]